MYKLKVTADKLNIRNTPVADSTYANWIGELLKGEGFVAESIIKGELYNGIDLWAKDSFNRFVTLSEFGDDDPRIPWSLRVLGVPTIWNVTKGEGVKIAIIDSGIDMKNPDLSNAVPLGNRFNVLNSTNDVQDIFDRSHGTFCATICASRGDNGLLGVAPACELIIIKIANNFLDYFNEANQLRGIQQAINSNADIISMSFGIRKQNSSIKSLLGKAMQSGIICIAATGDHPNEPNVEYPANYKGMISVGSISCSNRLTAKYNEGIFSQSQFSTGGIPDSQNEGVTVVAPGDNVMGYDNHGKMQEGIGTSFATPYVAGIAALWLAIIREKKIITENNHQSFKNFIQSNTIKNFNNNSLKFSGFGIINPMPLLFI